MSGTAMEYFYIREKDKNIQHLVEYVEANTGNLNDLSVINNMERICRIQNISLVVFDQKSKSPFIMLYNRDSDEMLTKKINEYISSGMVSNKVTNEYHDEYLNINFREIIGHKDNFYYYSKTPVDTMEDSANIATVFIVISMAVVIPIGIVLIYLSAKRLNEPIKELVDYSQAMAKMKFNNNFEPSGNTEIYELGSNIKNMGQALENNIEKLKIANKVLKRDIRSREELEKTKLEYLSQISHELKTPTAVILGYSEMLIEKEGDYPDIINKEARKMEAMVKSILSMDLSCYKGFLKLEPICIYDLVEEIITPLENLYRNRDINVEMSVNNDIIINTNKALMSQILSNFIVNAIEFSDKDVKIYIEEKLEKRFICVYNSGNEIKDEETNLIWDKFYTSNSNRNLGGNGLGLSIAKDSAAILNKEIGFKNLGNGVVFYVEI